MNSQRDSGASPSADVHDMPTQAVVKKDGAAPVSGTSEADRGRMPEPDVEILPPGTLVGRYRIQRVLGSGGMGAVYAAVHQDLGRTVAIKTLHPHLASDEQLIARFLREARAAARLKHANVVDVFDVGTDAAMPYMVMEYLDGEDLASLCQREAPLDVPRTTDVMLPVVAAVASIHDVGILHRDLKPANVFLVRRPDGSVQPKLLDFGISKIRDDDQQALTASSAILGTPHFMSPEHTLGASQITQASDQYALGVILYCCVTGRQPFDGTAPFAVLYNIAKGQFRPPRALRPEIPAVFEAIILKAMAREASGRFASVRELGQALVPFASPSGRRKWSTAFEGGPAVSAPSQSGEPTPPADAATDPPTAPRLARAPLPPVAAPTVPTDPPGVVVPAGTDGRSTVWLVALGVAVLAVVAVVAVLLGRSGHAG